MDAQLRAGVAIFNGGEYHAAHDAWEEPWLDLDDGTDDERLLHGLIQYTAAVYHASTRNWSGTVGLATSAREYLSGLPSPYRRVDVSAVRNAATALERDPERIERGPVRRIPYDGDAITVDDLDFDATCVAAAVLAAEYDYDEAIVDRAIDYARDDLDDGVAASEFVTFLFDFVREPDRRGVIFQRLSEHVQRRKHRNEDVDGLFE